MICDYVGCKAQSVGAYPRKYASDWRFCAEHAQQKHHPRDVDMRRFVLDKEP